MDILDLINRALELAEPYTRKYNSEDMHLGFFTPDKFEEELGRFCKAEGLECPPIPKDRIPDAVPIPPDGILLSSELIKEPRWMIFVVVSSVFHLFFLENEYDGDVNDLLLDYPVSRVIPDRLVPEVMDMHRIVIYRRIGYTIWSAFLADFMAQYILMPYTMSADDIEMSLYELSDDPQPVAVAELAKSVLGCPQYAEGVPGKGFIFKPGVLPFEGVMGDLANQLGQEKYYQVTPEFLTVLGRDFETDMAEYEKNQK